MSKNEASGNGAAAAGTAAPRIGIGAKIALLMVVCFGATFTATGLYQLERQAETARALVRTSGLNQAALLAGQMSGPVRFRDGDRLLKIAQGNIRSDGDLMHLLLVVDRTGAVLATQVPEAMTEDDQEAAFDLRTLAAQTLETGEDASLIEDVHVSTAVPIRKGGLPDGEIVGALVVEWDSSATLARLSDMSRQILMVSGAVSLAGLALALVVVRWLVSRPLHRISSAMARVAGHDYDAEIPHAARGDEMGAIARRLSEFRDRLGAEEQERVERERSAAQRHAEDEAKRRLFDHLAEALARVADGSLDERIDADAFNGLDERSLAVCANYNELIDAFAGVLQTISDSARMVRTNAEEISEVAADMSERSEEQAVALEDSAAALEELTASVRQTAENAADASARIVGNREQAETGRQVLNDTVAAMKKIEDSSSQINAIISVIDDIAFQTNLLALNAGVEAARAGEAGRGFAVVASEVRALARRASDSAGEIKDLIVRSEAHVEEGGRLVGRTGEALGLIVDEVARIADLVEQIAEASRDQSESLAEISTGIIELDDATQQNAAVTEEISASSRAQSREARALAGVIARFEKGTSVTPADRTGFALAREWEGTGSGERQARRVVALHAGPTKMSTPVASLGGEGDTGAVGNGKMASRGGDGQNAGNGSGKDDWPEKEAKATLRENSRRAGAQEREAGGKAIQPGPETGGTIYPGPVPKQLPKAGPKVNAGAATVGSAALNLADIDEGWDDF